MAENKPSASKKKNSLLAQAEAKAEKMVKDSENAKKAAKNGKSPKKKTNGFVKYFKDLKSEFKKVVWPSRQKVINNTGVVLVFMTVTAIFIWGLDSGLSQLLKLALNA